MTYAVGWDDGAFKAAATYLNDGPGLSAVMDAVDGLADGPRPFGAMERGHPDRMRVHIGRYRVWYDIDEDRAAVKIIHLGRVP